METISISAARRLAVARAGLLRPERTGLPTRAVGRGRRARDAAGAIIRRFGYLQLDTVCVTGARSHSLVLMSRLAGASPGLGESLLAPGEPLFEYWGHEAGWIPIELYRFFEFRRRHYSVHPWWGDLLGEHPRVADAILDQLRDLGPQRVADSAGSVAHRAHEAGAVGHHAHGDADGVDDVGAFGLAQGNGRHSPRSM